MHRIAHRGLWGPDVPENSMAAFQAAAERGLGIELDVQLSKDGVPMVFHDATLERMTGKEGFIFDRTAEALAKISLKGGAGQTIPTLEDVLDMMPNTLPVFIEIKPPPPESPFEDKKCAEKVLLRVTQGLEKSRFVMSFSPIITEKLRQTLPKSQVGYLASEGDLSSVLSAKKEDTGFATVWREDVAKAREILGSNGPKLFTWTIKTKAQEAAVAPYVDGVIFEGF